MQCRPDCGACCIAPSIVTAYFGMPFGKPAGVPCVHLDESMRCALFGDSRRPKLCSDFAPEESVCGSNREEAMLNLASLELASAPDGLILRSGR